ncbi:MAG: M67 family metallopeptidase [Cyanobacteria bacterium P01_A01_bin.135]
MVLQSTPEQIEAIAHIGEQAYPEEGCGILLGKSLNDQVRQLIEVRPVINVWSADDDLADLMPESTTEHSKTNRYTIDPRDLLQAQRDARDQNLDVIGIVHSHPDHPAIPSECDRAVAWSHYSYIIASIHQGTSKDVLCWRLDGARRFQPEALLISP